MITSAPQNKLTIYSHSGHIIQKVSSSTITLPKSVNIDSIIAINSETNAIIPFSYIQETTFIKSLTDRSTGDKIDASVIKNNQMINGKILSLDDNNVVLMTDCQISSIRKYDQIIINIANDLTRPHLIFHHEFKSATLSYLISNISWTCNGTALISDNILYLRLAGTINNNTETDIAAKVTLVSGDVYQSAPSRNQSYEYAPRAMVKMSAPIDSEKTPTSMLEDYTRYDVGNRVVHAIDIAELGTETYPITKIYIHDTSSDDKVQFGYRFEATGFIPACSINVYSINCDMSIDSYLGSNNIKESQKGDTVDVILGGSTVLQCKSLISISNDTVIQDDITAGKYNLVINHDHELHMITEDITTDIYNKGSKNVQLLIKHYVGNKLLVESKCEPYKKREHGFIEWYFEIEAGMKSQFTCQIITIAYN